MPRSAKPTSASATPPHDDATAAAQRVGQRAKAERLRLGLTQDEAAAKAGLNLKHLQKLEAGTLNPSLSTLVRLAEGLRTTVGHIVEEDAWSLGDLKTSVAHEVEKPEELFPRKKSRKGSGTGSLIIVTGMNKSLEEYRADARLASARHEEPRQNPVPPPRPGQRRLPPTPEELMRAIGFNVVALRLECGWSQQELADRVGISVSTLAQLENGKQNITVSTLAMLAQALDTYPSTLTRSIAGAPPSSRKPRVRVRRG